VERVALSVLRAHRGSIPTQRALWEAVSRRLWEEEPPLRVGPERMRALLAGSTRLRLEVRYANRPLKRPMLACPVCRNPVKPRYNATLWGDTVIVGYRCTVCPFWTPIRRRVPARYAFRALPWGMGKLST
jgi:hypothetical protein